MKYLVTGGAGFIGANLCRRLLDDGHKVLCLDDLSTGRERNISELMVNENFEYVKHDITKPFFPEQLDGIFNLASPASPVHYQYNPIRTLKMGTLAIYNVLGMAIRMDIPILQTSTSEVYGDPLEHPQKEEYWGNVNPIGPRACYDEGKRVAEALCMAYKDYNGAKIRIARIFNSYGPYMDPDDGRVVSNFVVQAIKGQDLTIYGDGTQTRSFCFVEDTVDGLIRLFNSEYDYPVNIGSDNEKTLIELAETVCRLKSVDMKIIQQELPVDDPKRRCPDLSRAKKVLNWSPTTNLDDGISKTIEWFESII
ncbi:SDR family oxidoreductase [Marine Group III euryarchaeote]|nr:SDR family oxidoreductase [Marine Group III euryarchaeote]